MGLVSISLVLIFAVGFYESQIMEKGREANTIGRE